MMHLRSLSIALLATIYMGQVAAAQTPSETPAPGASSAPGAGVTLWLNGPFGRIATGAQSNEVLADDGGGLDAWVQSAPLAVDTGAPGVTVQSWKVTSEDDPRTGPQELTQGSASRSGLAVVPFAGPELPGSYLIVAEVVTADGDILDGAWRVQVPERPFPPDGVLDIPAPVALLASANATATGWPGHGCYVFLCVEVGLLQPVESLESLAVTAGDSLELRLSDGSPFTLGDMSFTPLHDDGDAWAPSEPEVSHGRAQRVEMTAPPPGEWLLELEIVYDRERGFSETLFRLASQQPAN